VSISRGTLYVVATPLGNLEDLSARAVRVLAEADIIACEDTRHSRKMLQKFAVRTPCVAMHEHNEREILPELIERLKGGQALAVISDAGTPLVSDPGYRLVSAAHEAGCRVVPVPGPSAAIGALSVAGLPTDHFVFEGFLPSKQAARRSRLEVLRAEPRTLIFYESPHRIAATLNDMADIFGERRMAAFVREMTKIYETVRRDTLGHLAHWVGGDPEQRMGEIVVVVEGTRSEPEATDGDAQLRRMLHVLLARLPLKEAVALAVELTQERKNKVYGLAVSMIDR